MGELNDQTPLTGAGWPTDKQAGGSSEGAPRKRPVLKIVTTAVVLVLLTLVARPIWEATVPLDTREAIEHWFQKHVWGDPYDGTLLGGR